MDCQELGWQEQSTRQREKRDYSGLQGPTQRRVRERKANVCTHNVDAYDEGQSIS